MSLQELKSFYYELNSAYCLTINQAKQQRIYKTLEEIEESIQLAQALEESASEEERAA